MKTTPSVVVTPAAPPFDACCQRRRATARQYAGALADGRRTARSVLELLPVRALSSRRTIMPALAKTAIYVCQKMFLPPLAFSKPGVILIPLEVYMVNSPSRPMLRPVAPPPLGRPVRPPLPLPHPCTRPARGGDSRSLDVGCFVNQPPIKAKTPAIVPNQASSRQTRKFPSHPTSRLGTPHLCPSAFICGHNPLSRFWRISRFTLRPCAPWR